MPKARTKGKKQHKDSTKKRNYKLDKLTDQQRIAYARSAVSDKLNKLELPPSTTSRPISSPKDQELLKEIKEIGRGYHNTHYTFDNESRKLATNLVKSIRDREIDAAKGKKKRVHYLGADKTKKSRSQTGGKTTNDGPAKLTELGEPNRLRGQVNANSRQLQWGLGVEHEMQIFHAGSPAKGPEGFDAANIIFDSQESTCFITGDNHKQGACCKLAPGNTCYYHPATSKLRKMVFRPTDKLTKEEQAFLSSLDWELTGRRARGCKPRQVIVPRAPVLMPELVTSNFRNRSINSIANETRAQERIYLAAQMKNPFTREKVRKYGPLVTHICAALDNIKVPRRPTIFHSEYNLESGTWSDYVGSYHVTLTLPHPRNIDRQEFIKMHQDCANAIQWLEPLLITAFFGPDMAAVGDGPEPGIEGSFRIMAVGWGNLAGSDVRKFGTEGIGRGAVRKTKWREGFRLKGTRRIRDCVRTAPPQYKKAVDILTSDFRTFNFESDMDKCLREHTPYDCPKVDGGLMEPPYGMEIRIFDHFPSEYVLDLLKIIVRVAALVVQHSPGNKYVYNNKAWRECVQGVMREGWNYHVQPAYISELRTVLGLKLDGSGSRVAHDVFHMIIAEMHEMVHNSVLVGLMDETPNVAPRIPDFNRICWEISFRQKGYQRMVLAKLRRVLGSRSRRLSLSEFKSSILDTEKEHPDVNRVLNNKRFGHQIEDMVYALETAGYVTITKTSKTGKIAEILIKGPSKSGKTQKKK